MKRIKVLIVIPCLLLAIIMSACGTASAAKPEQPAATPFITITPSIKPPTQTPAPSSTASPAPVTISLWLPPYLPLALRDSVRLPSNWVQTRQSEGSEVTLDVAVEPESAVIQWVYALVAPFPTISDHETLTELQTIWKANKEAVLPLKTILVDASTRAVFEKKWGPAGAAVQTVTANEILQSAWSDEDRSTWAIVPFEDLKPGWKVISVNNQSPVQKDFQISDYALTVGFGFLGNQDALGQLSADGYLQKNYDPDKMTSVILTGVTAMVRGTASLMEGMGMTYPARDIGPWLREADILHISNEVPFARNCPQPFDWKDLVFCSQTEYIKLLEDVGTDVVELTGDHFADWGPDAMLYTLDLYKERGWKYYGGGANLKEAQQPALFEHNGNKIAFLGCNGKEPGYATASTNDPGAGHCDFDILTARIKEVRAQGYLPIVTFQHLEYYQYVALPELKTDFQRVAAAGAVIVSGSQAHQPHAFEFYDGALVHYGLGNLFFDQTNQGDAPRTAFIDRHIFYGGRHISTELFTIYLVDYARSRPMTLVERQTMLKEVFNASQWK